MSRLINDNDVDEAAHSAMKRYVDKSYPGEHGAERIAVRKQAEAFGDIGIDGGIAVHHEAPEPAPQAEYPVADEKPDNIRGTRKIEKSGGPARFEHAVTFSERCTDIGSVAQRIAARDYRRRVGTDGKRRHVLTTQQERARAGRTARMRQHGETYIASDKHRAGPAARGQNRKVAGAGGDIEHRTVDFSGKVRNKKFFPRRIPEKGHQAGYPGIFRRNFGEELPVVIAFGTGVREQRRIIVQI